MDSVWWLVYLWGNTEILCGALKACLDGGAGIYVWQREQTQLPLMYFVGSLSLASSSSSFAESHEWLCVVVLHKRRTAAAMFQHDEIILQHSGWSAARVNLEGSSERGIEEETRMQD